MKKPSPLVGVVPEYVLAETEERLRAAVIRASSQELGDEPVTTRLRAFDDPRASSRVRQALNALFVDWTTAGSRVGADIYRSEPNGASTLEYEIVLYRPVQ